MTSGHHLDLDIKDFLECTPDDIIGRLLEPTQQSHTWRYEIEHLQKELLCRDGRIIFEYGIPGVPKVVDVILLIKDNIFVLEYKHGANSFNRHDIIQVLGYAIRLRNLHSESQSKKIIPILIATKSTKSENLPIDIKEIYFEDNISDVCKIMPSDLSKVLDIFISNVDQQTNVVWQESWSKGVFQTSPNIIEAVQNCWEGLDVVGMTSNDQNKESLVEHLLAEKIIDEIIEKSKLEKRKSLVFVTGVPGAGKTLIGLNTSVKHQKEGASLLSGNDPLVRVFSAILKKHFNALRKAGDIHNDIIDLLDNGSIPKKEKDRLMNEIAVEAIIRSVYGYKNEIIERLDYTDPSYPVKDGCKKSTQHVIIYDEAQRAWSLSRMKTGGRVTHEWQKDDRWNFSEPSLLLWDIDKLEWGVFICLVGGGQEINDGESGINEWLRTLAEDYDKFDIDSWKIYMADELKSKEYLINDKDGHDLNYYLKELDKVKSSKRLTIERNPGLHLRTTQRSPLASSLASFVNDLVEGRATRDDYEKLESRYTIYLTRNLDLMRRKMRESQEQYIRCNMNGGNVRVGLLMSSNAERLRPLGLEMKNVGNFISGVANWFLDNKEENVDSSDFLEVALTEFLVQGLEVDIAGVVWDADFRYDENNKSWRYFNFNKYKWSEIQKKGPASLRKSLEVYTVAKQKRDAENLRIELKQRYMQNAYRVLLTRGRLEMFICVPEGDPKDKTRAKENYDSTYNYLKRLGFRVLD